MKPYWIVVIGCIAVCGSQSLRAECPTRDWIVAAQDQPFPTNPVVRDAWRQYLEAAAGKADAELCQTPTGQQTLALIGFECSSSLFLRHSFQRVVFLDGGIAIFYVNRSGSAEEVYAAGPGDELQGVTDLIEQSRNLCSQDSGSGGGGGGNSPPPGDGGYVPPGGGGSGGYWTYACVGVGASESCEWVFVLPT
jgi:hypothetical protein